MLRKPGWRGLMPCSASISASSGQGGMDWHANVWTGQSAAITWPDRSALACSSAVVSLDGLSGLRNRVPCNSPGKAARACAHSLGLGLGFVFVGLFGLLCLLLLLLLFFF